MFILTPALINTTSHIYSSKPQSRLQGTVSMWARHRSQGIHVQMWMGCKGSWMTKSPSKTKISHCTFSPFQFSEAIIILLFCILRYCGLKHQSIIKLICSTKIMAAAAEHNGWLDTAPSPIQQSSLAIQSKASYCSEQWSTLCAAWN